MTRYRLAEEEARKKLRDPVNGEGSLGVRTPYEGTNFLGPVKKQ